MDASDMGIGYAKSGFFPRSYNDHAILSNKADFIRDRARLNRFIFDQDLAAQADAPTNRRGYINGGPRHRPACGRAGCSRTKRARP